ncbi:hypothetical protein Ssi02_30020 [Sinosporangium siamense]|uniref:Uncharacterized protein n=2 Tax=Sinosporangium siamense TaxID=1367973 RepID=A0A919RIT5_9ACTN|nr:hypothetical protein Ssi02_30020 [Sinosporangium siamense]
MATGYAPELDFRGAVATAPPTSLTKLTLDKTEAESEERRLRTALYPLFLLGVSVKHTTVDPEAVVSGKALALMEVAENKCLMDVYDEMVKRKSTTGTAGRCHRTRCRS